MSEKQPKKKPVSNKSVNENRPNRKASKTSPDALFPHGKAYRGAHTRRSPQNEVQKVLLGGGVLEHADRSHAGSVSGRWRFGGMPNGPFDAAQARENRHLYPHLFTD